MLVVAAPVDQSSDVEQNEHPGLVLHLSTLLSVAQPTRRGPHDRLP